MAVALHIRTNAPTATPFPSGAVTAATVHSDHTMSMVFMRRRLVAALVAVVAIAGLWTMASLVVDSFSNGATADLTPAGVAALTETYVVQPGDTFWSIAERRSANGDLRQTVDSLIEANGGSSVLNAGDRLEVPVG